MVTFLLGVSVLQFIFFLAATMYSDHEPFIWLYAFNVVMAVVGIVFGFLNIFGCAA